MQVYHTVGWRDSTPNGLTPTAIETSYAFTTKPEILLALGVAGTMAAEYFYDEDQIYKPPSHATERISHRAIIEVCNVLSARLHEPTNNTRPLPYQQGKDWRHVLDWVALPGFDWLTEARDISSLQAAVGGAQVLQASVVSLEVAAHDAAVQVLERDGSFWPRRKLKLPDVVKEHRIHQDLQYQLRKAATVVARHDLGGAA